MKVIDKYSFSIEDTSFFAQYKKGGFAELVKVRARASSIHSHLLIVRFHRA